MQEDVDSATNRTPKREYVEGELRGSCGGMMDARKLACFDTKSLYAAHVHMASLEDYLSRLLEEFAVF